MTSKLTYKGNEAKNKAKLMTKVKTDQVMWKVYYHDKILNEYWVMEYPEAEGHGGGIPVLTKIDEIPNI